MENDCFLLGLSFFGRVQLLFCQRIVIQGINRCVLEISLGKSESSTKNGIESAWAWEFLECCFIKLLHGHVGLSLESALGLLAKKKCTWAC